MLDAEAPINCWQRQRHLHLEWTNVAKVVSKTWRGSRELEVGSRELEVGSRESRVMNQESRIKNQESRIKNQESRSRNQEPRSRNQKSPIESK